MRVHRQRLGHFTAAQHLDREPLAVNESGFAQRVSRNRFARVEHRLELIEIHDRVLGAEDVVEPALRQAAMQRHLAAFETALERIPRTRLRALVSAAGGLAVPRAWATTHALLVLLRA